MTQIDLFATPQKAQLITAGCGTGTVFALAIRLEFQIADEDFMSRGSLDACDGLPLGGHYGHPGIGDDTPLIFAHVNRDRWYK